MAATAASDSTDGPVLSVISKRLRALRKKHNRIIQMEESLAQGKSLNKEQEDVLRSKPSVLASIDELEKLRPQLSAAVQEEVDLALQRHPVSPPSGESAPSRGESELKDLLNLLYFGALFDVKSPNDFTATMLTRTHERGCCLTYDYVTDDATDLLGENDLDAISSVGNLLMSRPVDTSLSHKNALERCLEHAKLWLSQSEQAVESNSGITYAALREKLNKIMVSDYFTATPEMKAPVDVAAAGNYSPVQVQGNGSSLQVTEVPVEEGSSDGQYEQKGGEEGVNHEQNATIQASPVEEVYEHEAEEGDTSEAPPAQAEEADQQAEDEEFNQQRDRDMKEQQFQSRRPYQNHRGGRGGVGGRRGYYGGRGGRGGGGGRNGGGYQNGRHQYFDQPGNNYYPRGGYYNNRGRGGRGGGGPYNNYNNGAPVRGGHGSVDVGAA